MIDYSNPQEYPNPDKPWIGAPKEKPKCPRCKATNLVTMPTLNLKHCGECEAKIPWFKEPGQPDYY